MKNNLIRNFILLVLSIISMGMYAQIKYVGGKLNINNAAPVGNYGILVNTWQGMYWTCNNNYFFQLDVSPMSPRLAGSSDQVVFYNTQTQTFNSIQVANVYNYSDARAKENVESLTSGLNTILSLRPVSYKWKKNYNTAKVMNEADNEISSVAFGPDADDKVQYGFLAQEVESVVPDAVITDEEGHKMINYTSIIPMLVQAVQELQARVEAQALQIEQLSNGKDSFRSNSIANKIISCSPNPTNGRITIITNLTNNVNNAKLVISNLEGNNEVQLEVSYNTPNVSTDISNLTKGIHIVSLYVNNKLVDSQRIIKQ